MKFMIVALVEDEQLFECSVYDAKEEARARKAIEVYNKQKGIRLTGETIEAADMAAAKRMAEERLPHHHYMPDLLKDIRNRRGL